MREIWESLKRWWCADLLDKVDALDLTEPALKFHRVPSIPVEKEFLHQLETFAVTSKPRHIPWSRRKKELEADARQKRRAREEFREQS
jgi:hypothetical protein